jgi:hypothetical protein
LGETVGGRCKQLLAAHVEHVAETAGRRVSPRRGKGVLSEAEAKQVGAWIVDTEGCGSIVFSPIG